MMSRASVEPLIFFPSVPGTSNSSFIPMSSWKPRRRSSISAAETEALSLSSLPFASSAAKSLSTGESFDMSPVASLSARPVRSRTVASSLSENFCVVTEPEVVPKSAMTSAASAFLCSKVSASLPTPSMRRR